VTQEDTGGFREEKWHSCTLVFKGSLRLQGGEEPAGSQLHTIQVRDGWTRVAAPGEKWLDFGFVLKAEL
jgi:hypothetical protein